MPRSSNQKLLSYTLIFYVKCSYMFHPAILVSQFCLGVSVLAFRPVGCGFDSNVSGNKLHA